MKRLLWLVLVLIPIAAWATRVEMPETDGDKYQCLKSGGTENRPAWRDCNPFITWDEMNSPEFQSPQNEYIKICNGCLKTNPCTEGEDSDTALAFWERDHWSCDPTVNSTTTTSTTTTTEESTTTTEESTTTTTL